MHAAHHLVSELWFSPAQLMGVDNLRVVATAPDDRRFMSSSGNALLGRADLEVPLRSVPAVDVLLLDEPIEDLESLYAERRHDAHAAFDVRVGAVSRKREQPPPELGVPAWGHVERALGVEHLEDSLPDSSRPVEGRMPR